MTSFELDILDEKSRAGAEFLARIVEEMQRALVIEKSVRKITQQAIADKIGTSRHVINRELQGLENVTARRIGEFFWAIGWEPHFEAKKPSGGQNCDFLTPRVQSPAPVPPAVARPSSEILGGKNILELLEETKAAAPVPQG
jgi:hypothetical protein